MARPILYLDISRLLRRYEHFGGPTGVDRVDIQYAEWLTRQTLFEGIAVTRSRRGLLALSAQTFATVLATLNRRWGRDVPPGFGREGRNLLHYGTERTVQRLARWRLLSGATAPNPAGRPSLYLNVSHEGLDVPQNYAGLPGAKVALVHDVLPLTHPEYDTRRTTLLHGRRVAAIAAHMDHVIANSAATVDELRAITPAAKFGTTVAHLGPSLAAPAAPAPAQRPTFVHLSSINRRKNLGLLLHIWREMAADGVAPHLAIIGRRGNDNTALELIDRCDALADHVTVHGAVNDSEAAAIVASARGLLTPSFAEGFGLPIVEAHHMGVPVIASDLAVHREVGGAAAIYCAPTDGPAWRRAILSMATDDAAHAARVAAIVPPPTWQSHLETVEAALLPLAR
ncbi:glycosyltransferase family 1 protein [Acuticoccus sp. MNP-M23]|uniref:glycosyltransferase family 4 protein n=1 Tax=Acuticoccus sp. MNP-M23 TaxID=3072793 RepID=UPI0028168FF4|nr:glycosyltransferase family 1 protein [Acuticoccus sp. MNP-M23]WMS41068.1 glycosyltransferase family 1 protein [Acuticoccus sp. MNP-M23]